MKDAMTTLEVGGRPRCNRSLLHRDREARRMTGSRGPTHTL
jgi:hypothetical protein